MLAIAAPLSSNNYLGNFTYSQQFNLTQSAGVAITIGDNEIDSD